MWKGTGVLIESESFVIAEWADDGSRPGLPIAGLHLHRSDDEAWYVLDGRLGFRVGDGEVEAGPGEVVLVPRGTPHSFWNGLSEPTRYLIVMPPRLHALVEALHAPGAGDYRQIFEDYDSELLA